MASTGRSRPSGEDAPPREFPSVPAPTTTPMMDHSFTLQAIMEVQKSIGVLSAKTDRLIEDFQKHADRLDDVRHTITFVKGACWVIGGLLALGWAVFLLYLGHRFLK